MKKKNLFLMTLWASLAVGCAQPPQAPAPAPVAPVPPAPAPPPPAPARITEPPRYTCEQGVAFIVRFTNGTAIVDAGPLGTHTLLRDAGGVTPQQSVFSNPQLRAEFGLGTGDEAALHFAAPALEVKCRRG